MILKSSALVTQNDLVIRLQREKFICSTLACLLGFDANSKLSRIFLKLKKKPEVTSGLMMKPGKNQE